MRLETAKRKFYSKIVKQPNGCWEFQGSAVPKGYVQFRVLPGISYAHRFSYTIHCGPLMKGMCVLHKCDNPPCVNPKHLFVGSDADNVRDMIEKGRSKKGKRYISKCRHGHEFTNETSRFKKDGTRYCGICHIEGSRRRDFERRQGLR